MIQLSKEQKYLLQLISQYKKHIAYICIFLIISTGINLVFPLISRSIMDNGFIEGNFDLLIKLIFIVFFLKIIDQFIEWSKERLRIGMQLSLRKKLWEESFLHVLKIKLTYFDVTNEAQIINNLETDIESVSNIFDGATIFIITQIFSVIGGLIGLFIINPILTFIVMMFAPVKYTIVRYFTNKRENNVLLYIKTREDYTKWLSGMLSGIEEIRIFGLQKQKSLEFKQKQEKILNTNREMDMISIKNNISDVILMQILSTTLYIIGAIKVFNSSMTIGGIFAFLSYSVYVTTPISAILNIKFFLSGIIPSTKRYMEYLSLKEEDDSGKTVAQNKEIIFRDVSFSYKNEKDIKIFEKLNLLIEKGDKLAIIGENGSGKSTLLKMMLRFYTPESGGIFLGEQEIHTYSMESYRKLFSVVGQDIYLFNDTLRNNISLNQEFSDNDILKILEKVNLKEFVQKNLWII